MELYTYINELLCLKKSRFSKKNNVKLKNVLFHLPDKILVHHWGHFRWGLFDEHGDKESPVMASTNNPWFYSSEGTFKPNMYATYILR